MEKEVVNVTDANFDEEVFKSRLPVMVDFWAEWCPPCKLIAPLIDELARHYKNKIKVAKVDIDANPGIAAELSISNIPAIIFFKEGREFKRITGANPKRVFEKIIKEVL